MIEALALWRRHDVAGHDACRLLRFEGGWQLNGTAVFLNEGSPANLAYGVACDARWATRTGFVRGWSGSMEVNVSVERAEGGWTVNGSVVSGLEGCVDLDLGFTPATNLIQLRRLALGIGDSVEVAVAWLDVPQGSLEHLGQTYERRSEHSYRYEAPRFGYSAGLDVDSDGFVREYPGLWTRES